MLSEPTNDDNSPDLGPPPIAHFVEEDPIKFNPSDTQSEHGQGLDGIHEISAMLSSNLETRKKRRDSTGVPDFERAGRFGSKIGQAIEPSSAVFHDSPEQTLRASAKRKLDARDVEERFRSTRPTKVDDFTFQRNAAAASSINEKQESENITSTENRVSSKVTQDLAAARGAKRDKLKGGTTVSALSGRRALGPSKCRPTSNYIFNH